jgi:hypothetical protein
MGFLDKFKKKDRIDPLKDLVLSKMKVGWFLDYDLITWEVTAVNIYDFEGDEAIEWQLKSAEETVYLELEADDEDFWSFNKKIAFAKLGPEVRDYFLTKDSPPEQISYDGLTYFLDEEAGGHYLKDGEEPGREVLRFSYMDDSEKKILEVEQWGEKDFEASTGIVVEEYMFSNILPRL